MGSLTTVFSRIAALALLFGVAIGLYFLIAAPIVDKYADNYRQASSLREQIARYKTIAEHQVGLRAELVKLENNSELTAIYWTGGTAAVAGASLQMLVNQLVVQKGGVVRSIANLTDKKTEEAATIAIKVLFSADMAAVQEILYEIERQSPILFVETIELRKARKRSRRKSKSPNRFSKLQVDLKISGYFLKN